MKLFVSHVQFTPRRIPYGASEEAESSKNLLNYCLADSVADATALAEDHVREKFPSASIQQTRVLDVSDDFVIEAAKTILKQRGLM